MAISLACNRLSLRRFGTRSIRLRGLAALVLVGLGLSTSEGYTTVWPVDPAGTPSYPHIQAVVDSAVFGDTLDLADGLYIGAGNSNIIVNKGLHIRSTSGDPTACIIDGGGESQVIRFQEIFTAESVLDGVTIQNGYDPRWGGGIVIYLSGSPIIRNCIIRDCEAPRGGGIAAVGTGAPLLQDTWIINNRGNYGGGLYATTVTGLVIENSVIGGNRARFLGGGGMWVGVNATVTVRQSTVALNYADRLGGGLFVHAFSTVNFESSILRRNCAGEDGHDAYLWDQTVTVDLSCSNSNPELIVHRELAPPVFDVTNDDRDPLICGSPDHRCADSVSLDDFYLAANSPCLPAISPCGVRVGALGEMCGAQTPIQVESWSSLKSKF